MRIDISFLPALATAFLLTFARVGAMVMLLPGVGELSVPSRVRLTIALVLTAKEARTMPLMVVSFVTDEGVLWGPMSAAATVALLPPVIFVLLTHRHLAKGLTMGGVKG